MSEVDAYRKTHLDVLPDARETSARMYGEAFFV
jgi:hypothetical protein